MNTPGGTSQSNKGAVRRLQAQIDALVANSALLGAGHVTWTSWPSSFNANSGSYAFPTANPTITTTFGDIDLSLDPGIGTGYTQFGSSSQPAMFLMEAATTININNHTTGEVVEFDMSFGAIVLPPAWTSAGGNIRCAVVTPLAAGTCQVIAAGHQTYITDGVSGASGAIALLKAWTSIAGTSATFSCLSYELIVARFSVPT